MLLRFTFALPLLVMGAAAAPLPDGITVDFVVIPVGPVPPAVFEADTPQPPSDGQPGKSRAGEAAATGGGSRARDRDVNEIPPCEVFLPVAKGKYARIPCSLNSLTSPVRVPLTESSVVFHLRVPDGSETLHALDPVTLDPSSLSLTGTRILVVLTKPAGDSRWTKPTVSLIPVPDASSSRLLVVNASASQTCGAVLGASRKILLPPMRHYAWKPTDDAGQPAFQAALAVADGARGFHPPFYQDNLGPPSGAVAIVIAYEVTPAESFRRAKYVAGTLRTGEFQAPLPWPDRASPGSPDSRPQTPP